MRATAARVRNALVGTICVTTTALVLREAKPSSVAQNAPSRGEPSEPLEDLLDVALRVAPTDDVAPDPGAE